jgi:DNA-binding transcriptional ArsR family regulator
MNTNQIARLAALIGEPARAAMLLELMDGRSLTANELATAGSITPQTASRHLAQMVEAGLMCVEQRGRHRYHRLASSDVAKTLEGLMQMAAGAAPPKRQVQPGPKDEAMRTARMCYDHIAGRLGLAIAEHLQVEGAIEFDGDGGQVTPLAEGVMSRWGLSLGPLAARGRPQCRPCLDWSERKPHLAGRLGALICAHCLDQGWLTRRPGARALAITPRGAASLRDLLGLEAWRRVM